MARDQIEMPEGMDSFDPVPSTSFFEDGNRQYPHEEQRSTQPLSSKWDVVSEVRSKDCRTQASCGMEGGEEEKDDDDMIGVPDGGEMVQNLPQGAAAVPSRRSSRSDSAGAVAEKENYEIVNDEPEFVSFQQQQQHQQQNMLSSSSANMWEQFMSTPSGTTVTGDAFTLPQAQASTSSSHPTRNFSNMINSSWDGRSTRSKRFSGRGMTAPYMLGNPLSKDTEMRSTLGKMWEGNVWDFEILDTPVGPGSKDSKYLPMGHWVEKAVPCQMVPAFESITDSKDGVAAVQAASGIPVGIPVDMKAAREGMETKGEASPTSSVVTPIETRTIRTFQTPTREELDSIRPDSYMYYSREVHEWALFAPMPEEPENAVANTRVETWRETGTPFDDASDYHELSHYYIPPARLDALSPEYNPLDGDDMDPMLSLLESTLGRRVLYVGSQGFPCVIPKSLWQAFLTRSSSPPPGETKEVAILACVSVLWRALDSLLFKGESRALPTDGKVFSKRMPYDDITRSLFVGIFGFLEEDGNLLMAPSVDGRSEIGLLNRKRALRGWLEVGLWIEDCRMSAKVDPTSKLNTRLKIKSAKPAALQCLGGDNLPRRTKLARDERFGPQDAPLKQYNVLGACVDFSDDVLIALYEEQIKYDAFGGPEYLEALNTISTYLNSEALQVFVAQERSQKRYTTSDIRNAYWVLDCAQHDAPSEDIVTESFTRKLEAAGSVKQRRTLREAFEMIAEVKGSDFMRAVLASSIPAETPPKMELSKAYRLLEADGMTDEDLLISVFNIRVIDDPAQTNSMREALQTIGEHIHSSKIAYFLKTGSIDGPVSDKPKIDITKAYQVLDAVGMTDDEMLISVFQVRTADEPSQNASMREALAVIGESTQSEKIRQFLHADSIWEIGRIIDFDRPVGLTNIANTCYLNSLLQYFFTVRELRDAILSFRIGPQASVNYGLHRVGGRLVTKAEVDRSQRFVLLLQDLFQQLIHAPGSSVTPETELAFLALVPSKDESPIKLEEEVGVEAGLGSGEPADKQAGSPMQVSPSGSPLRHSPSLISPTVLGKRRGDHLDADNLTLDPMVIDPLKETPSSEGDTDDRESVPLESPIGAGGGAVELDDISILASSSTVDLERLAKRGRSLEAVEPESTKRHSEPAGLDLTVTQGSDGVTEIGVPSHSSISTADVLGVAPPLPPRPAQSFKVGGSGYMAFGRQNDVTECADNIVFQLECALTSSQVKPESVSGTSPEEEEGAASILKRTFYGEMRQQLDIDDPEEKDRQRTKEEPFFSLLVDVAEEGRDVYDGLDRVFDDSVVEIGGHRAHRRISLVQVPNLLQIQLQRVQYDREEKKIYKSNAHLAYYNKISLDRYLDADPADEEAVERRRLSSERKEQLEKARARRKALVKDDNINMGQILRDTLDHLSDKGDLLGDVLTPDLAEGTAEEAVALEEEIRLLDAKMVDLRRDISLIWENHQHVEYELVSVFMHRGTASSGHYFIYQRDHRRPDRWLKYNDSQVTDMEGAEEVLKRPSEPTTNAYFLVYCRSDRIDAIESIKREI